MNPVYWFTKWNLGGVYGINIRSNKSIAIHKRPKSKKLTKELAVAQKLNATTIIKCFVFHLRISWEIFDNLIMEVDCTQLNGIHLIVYQWRLSYQRLPRSMQFQMKMLSCTRHPATNQRSHELHIYVHRNAPSCTHSASKKQQINRSLCVYPTGISSTQIECIQSIIRP